MRHQFKRSTSSDQRHYYPAITKYDPRKTNGSKHETQTHAYARGDGKRVWIQSGFPNYPTESVERLYSDLRPGRKSSYEKTKIEFEESGKKKYRKGYEAISEEAFPELSVAKSTQASG